MVLLTRAGCRGGPELRHAAEQRRVEDAPEHVGIDRSSRVLGNLTEPRALRFTEPVLTDVHDEGGADDENRQRHEQDHREDPSD